MFHVEPNSKKRLLASPKDHLVSGESFRVMLDTTTQIAQTSPFPSLEQLPAYYQHQAYISHGNANRTVVERMYGFVQGLMFWQKGKWLNPYFSKESTYLDYGCGTASFVNHLNRIGIDAYGVEPSKKARTFHKETKKVVATLNEIEKESFSVIALWHVLEHVPKPDEILHQLSNKLSSSGALILALPNFNSKDARLYKSEKSMEPSCSSFPKPWTQRPNEILPCLRCPPSCLRIASFLRSQLPCLLRYLHFHR